MIPPIAYTILLRAALMAGIAAAFAYAGWDWRGKVDAARELALVEKQLAALNEARTKADAESRRRAALVEQAGFQAARAQDEIERLAEDNERLIATLADAHRVRAREGARHDADRACTGRMRSPSAIHRNPVSRPTVPVRVDDEGIAIDRAFLDRVRQLAQRADGVLEQARAGQSYANALKDP